MKKPTLVVMAAGMGSRFGGLKQMTPIDPQGNSIIQYSLYDARLAGFDKVVFIIKHEIEHDFREKVGRGVEPYFDVSYVFQELTRTGPSHRLSVRRPSMTMRPAPYHARYARNI